MAYINQLNDLLHYPLQGSYYVYYKPHTSTFHIGAFGQGQPKGCITHLPTIIDKVNTLIAQGLFFQNYLQYFAFLSNCLTLNDRALVYNPKRHERCPQIIFKPEVLIVGLYNDLKGNFLKLAEVIFFARKFGFRIFPYGRLIDKFTKIKEILPIFHHAINSACQGDQKEYGCSTVELRRISYQLLSILKDELDLCESHMNPLRHVTRGVCLGLFKLVLKQPDLSMRTGNACLMAKISVLTNHDFMALFPYFAIILSQEALAGNKPMAETARKILCNIRMEDALHILNLMMVRFQGIRVSDFREREASLSDQFPAVLATIMAEYSLELDPLLLNLLLIIKKSKANKEFIKNFLKRIECCDFERNYLLESLNFN